MASSISSPYFRRTKIAIISSSLLNEPFIALYTLLPFILHKNLGATALQIVILAILKPVVSVFSFYWGSNIEPHKLKSNMGIAGILARIPFLFLPFIDNVWYTVFSGALYMLFTRAALPAWIEILKRNLSKDHREKLFSLGSALGYGGGVVLSLLIGQVLDLHAEMWKLFFVISSLLGILSVIIQTKLPIAPPATVPPLKAPIELKEKLVDPWKNMIRLFRTKPDFAKFQWGFMIGGFGLMLIIPILPVYFSDVLHLSYTDLAIAFCICKGLGFVFTSPIWAKAMNRFSISSLTTAICFGFAIFIFCLLISPYFTFAVYLAYILYGVAQAGSHLVWHLSGPIFAKGEDSSPYSGVNILTVGIRGMIGPALGGLFCTLFGPMAILALGSILCFYGGWHMRKKTAKTPAEA